MSVLKARVKSSGMENGILGISENGVPSTIQRKTSAPCLKMPSRSSPQRKTSLPPTPVTPPTPTPAIQLKKSTGKISCCTNFAGGYKKRAPEIKKVPVYQMPDPCTESTGEISSSPQDETAISSTQGKSEASLFASCFNTTINKYIPEPKPVIHKEELKRGSMKDKWGLKLVYQMSQEGGLCLGVLKVKSFTAGHKAKLQTGDHVLTINGWQIHGMDEPQVAANLFRAAGFSVVLRFQKSNLKLDGWDILDDF